MTDMQIALLGCALLLLLLTGSMPVGLAMGIAGLFGFALMVSPQAALNVIATDLYETFSTYSLTVIPLFVLMGQISFHAGISRRLFAAAYHWMGPMRGGLAMASVGACAAFGAICGSGPATAATMATVALPEMKRYRYDMELGSGAVAAGGTLGMLIPPSVVFIVYAVITEQSIGQLFMAGILPGLLVAGLFCATIYIHCRLRPHLGPPAPASTWREKWRSLLGVTETIIIFLLVMGGMFRGWFTPTEAAAIGAFSSLVVALVRRNLSVGAFMQSLRETVRTACMVMVIVVGAVIFGRFLAVTMLPQSLADALTGLPVPPWTVMMLIILFYLVAGCFIDALGLILLTIPIFFPVVTSLGYDPIWFGVIIVVVTQMGVISPPVGVCVYVVSGMERDIPLQVVFRGALPFLGALVIAAIILLMFPSISLFLPNLAQ